jgi:hypothetical protein
LASRPDGFWRPAMMPIAKFCCQVKPLLDAIALTSGVVLAFVLG